MDDFIHTAIIFDQFGWQVKRTLLRRQYTVACAVNRIPHCAIYLPRFLDLISYTSINNYFYLGYLSLSLYFPVWFCSFISLEISYWLLFISICIPLLILISKAHWSDWYCLFYFPLFHQKRFFFPSFFPLVSSIGISIVVAIVVAFGSGGVFCCWKNTLSPTLSFFHTYVNRDSYTRFLLQSLT